MSRNTIELIIKGSSQGVNEAVGGAVDGLRRLGDTAATALGTFVGNLMTGAIQRVGDLARAIGNTLLNEAPALDQVRRSFENLATSAGSSSQEVLESMREASRGMVTDADLMTSYNEAMLLVGESMADKFPALLEIAQASAAATGQDVGFMLESLVRGIGRASPQILDNLGLTINTAEAYDKYAAALGISADEMSKAQQQEALLNAVVDQGGEFVTRLGENTGGAAESVAQMRTTLENLKNEVALALLPALSELLVPLLQLAQEYGPAVIAWAVEAGTWLAQNLPGAIAALQEAWNTAWPVIEGAIAAVWPVVQQVLAQLQAWLQTDGPQALEVVRGAFGEVWPWIQSLVATVVTWFQANLPLMIAAGEAVVTFFQSHVAPTLNNVWAIIKATVESALALILNVITVTLAVIAGDWGTAWVGIQNAAVVVWNWITTVLGEFLEGVLNAIGSSTEEFVAVWRGNWEMFQEIVGLAWDAISEAVSSGIEQVLGFVSSMIAGIQAVWSGINWGELGQAIIEGIAERLRSGVSLIADAARQAAGAALDAAKEFLGVSSPSRVFAELGQNVVEGFAGRIAALAQMPAQAAGMMARETVQAATDQSRNVTIYGGVQQYGVQGGGLLAELQGMAV